MDEKEFISKVDEKFPEYKDSKILISTLEKIYQYFSDIESKTKNPNGNFSAVIGPKPYTKVDVLLGKNYVSFIRENGLIKITGFDSNKEEMISFDSIIVSNGDPVMKSNGIPFSTTQLRKLLDFLLS